MKSILAMTAVMWMLAATVAGVAMAEEPEAAAEDPPRVDEELRQAVMGLTGALAAGDAGAVDPWVCLEWRTEARLARAAALGLVADPADPAAATAYREAYRDALEAAFAPYLASGRRVGAVDVSRVYAEAGDERLVPGGEETITAGGIVAVHWLPPARPLDVVVERVGERWCLNPVTVE